MISMQADNDPLGRLLKTCKHNFKRFEKAISDLEKYGDTRLDSFTPKEHQQIARSWRQFRAQQKQQFAVKQKLTPSTSVPFTPFNYNGYHAAFVVANQRDTAPRERIDANSPSSKHFGKSCNWLDDSSRQEEQKEESPENKNAISQYREKVKVRQAKLDKQRMLKQRQRYQRDAYRFQRLRRNKKKIEADLTQKLEKQHAKQQQYWDRHQKHNFDKASMQQQVREDKQLAEHFFRLGVYI